MGPTLRVITSDELKQRLRSKSEHAILDVRREGDFSKGHLFFASNVPRSLLEVRIEGLIPKRQVPIALCAEDEASAVDAARVLAKFGYDDVVVLAEGVEGWLRDGGHIFSGVNVPSKAFGEFVEKTANTPHISPQSLKEMLDRRENIVIFDARPFAEYQTMSIPSAIDCPGGELVFRATANLPAPGAMVVVNCAGRTRSIVGAQTLIDAGIPNPVASLKDGTMAWLLSGRTLAQGRVTPLPEPTAAALEGARSRAEGVAARAGVRRIDESGLAALEAASQTHTLYRFDVRTRSEYESGHLPGWRWAPGGQLVQATDEYLATRRARIVQIGRAHV